MRLSACGASVSCRPRRVVLETSGVRGGRNDPRVLVYEKATWRRTTTPVHWGFRRSRALVLWAGSAASAVGLVDAREIAGDPRIIDTLEGVIRRPGAAARPALPPADAGGP
jgi:hypothetical protein